MNRLDQLLQAGCVLVSARGFRHVLASAAVLPDQRMFWFFEVFGEDQTSEHHLEFSRVEDDGYYLNFYGEDGAILATLSPIEDEEEREVWTRWEAFVAGPEGPRAAESIAWLRLAAINWEA